MSRPEEIAPPELFYNSKESKKYTENSRVQYIQYVMTKRSLELLNLKTSSFILDIGCGSCLSGEIISSATEEVNQGMNHYWTGLDISPDMLEQAIIRKEEQKFNTNDDDSDDEESGDVGGLRNGDMMLHDMGQGIPFRAGSFDAAISISAIQWLFNKDNNNQDPIKRIRRFFESLYSSLTKNGKFVAQFYPANDDQIDTFLQIAKQTGFSGGLVIDNPESKKNKKYYLVLSCGTMSSNDADDADNLNLSGAAMDASNIHDKKDIKKKRGNGMLESKKSFILRKRN
ncbi:hypothetical protein ACO0SA_003525 [Hanseniaspora valbyensis]